MLIADRDLTNFVSRHTLVMKGKIMFINRKMTFCINELSVINGFFHFHIILMFLLFLLTVMQIYDLWRLGLFFIHMLFPLVFLLYSQP
jgi:hypothetical protein